VNVSVFISSTLTYFSLNSLQQIPQIDNALKKTFIWQFSLVLKIKETGFRIKMAQVENGNLSSKLNKGTNVIASEQTTELISETNLQLRRRER
jgi:hypothetical protein